jgi:hypothetical protein
MCDGCRGRFLQSSRLIEPHFCDVPELMEPRMYDVSLRFYRRLLCFQDRWQQCILT